MPATDLPIRAATETAIAHGIVPDRCEILQDANTLVLRLTETLVARVVQDCDGPRQGTAWFARENAVAQHLAKGGAPVIPMHPDIPPGPHEHLGYPINFWRFVTRVDEAPEPEAVGRTLFHCHKVLDTFAEPLPQLAIITEAIHLLETLEHRGVFPRPTLEMLDRHLTHSVNVLAPLPHRPLHGDAHAGNLMNTTDGLLWTDWEDTFAGPVEWDLGSIIWNARIIDKDDDTADRILEAYQSAGGSLDRKALWQSMIARAAVMTAWYPILYPAPSPERQERLRFRLEWLEELGD
ncbi:aminoglycoside phosphotransferase family protein [Luteolibacter flavescens]|uniref:Aminoglycoside phosphotransferase family protein n=1 Tax=Luteolibacter flavescens TaxID=1859460 RepID=A0ABT3FL38_9BACT|nr:aminoglycoside phosphotransferase family protein [Luteolibacter flavescens]MCW1884167.1 aminoglycoside phosphotransferase family protein [Luteolibacter flavescens]